MEASILKLEDIVSVEVIDCQEVYDLTVEDNHNYYLATKTLPILVHNSGKSTFVDQVCIRLACRKNWKFGMFSPENDNKLKSIRMAEQIAGKPVHGNNRMTKELFERALEIINSKFYFYDTKYIIFGLT
jgi:hypothetical protein